MTSVNVQCGPHCGSYGLGFCRQLTPKAGDPTKIGAAPATQEDFPYEKFCNYYAVLGVAPTASDQEIQEAFKRSSWCCDLEPQIANVDSCVVSGAPVHVIISLGVQV